MATKLYVGNLSYSTTETKLRTLFAEYGEVESINVITDRETGRPRGFAFVEMATEQAAQAAISGLNDKLVDDRALKVDKAKPQPERRQGGGGGGRRSPRWYSHERRVLRRHCVTRRPAQGLTPSGAGQIRSGPRCFSCCRGATHCLAFFSRIPSVVPSPCSRSAPIRDRSRGPLPR